MSSPADDLADMAPDDLRDEVRRLRRLVGPDEQSYDDLRAELAAAAEAVRAAEFANGEIRGELAIVNTALAKARQTQGRAYRIVLQRARGFAGRVRRKLQRLVRRA